MRAFGKFASAIICVVGLGGCVSTSDPLTDEQMTTQKKGAIIYYVKTNEPGCNESFALGRYDPAVAGWKIANSLDGAHYGIYSEDTMPRVAWIEADRYAILSISCSYGNWTTVKSRDPNINMRPSLLRRHVWRDVIATFDVKPGEYVNIGELQTIATGKRTLLGVTYDSGPVQVVVSDTEPAKMQAFKTKHPEIAGRMVTRLMQKSSLFGDSAEFAEILARLKAAGAAGKSGKARQKAP